MLYEKFDLRKEDYGADFFTSRISDEIVQNLNPKFELREYQKEALGRFDFYFNGYQKRRFPAQLLFHMATGSGKTLIMAANILYLYALGYRNFIFFVNSVNIIEKTKDNFLNPLSEKYLFAPKIKFSEKQVDIKEVQNFQATNPANINIIFSTIQGLHTRLNYPKENVLTEEDFEGKDIVLISDEAHHIQTLTRNKLTKTLEEERKTWEYTIIKRIFGKNPKNILLEFTATIDLSTQEIVKKYEDKIIYQYDLKQFRLDKYSKEIEVLQEDFSEEKCMLLDSENVDEEKQLKLNSLESKNNETRAIFAVNMLNEGWDVLNLLYGISKLPPPLSSPLACPPSL